MLRVASARFAVSLRRAVATSLFATLIATPALALGLRPIGAVRIGGDNAVPIPFEELFYWYDDFGASIAPLGDFDGDSVEDVAVGAPGDPSSGFLQAGRVLLLFLASDGSVSGARAIDGASLVVSPPTALGDRFGASVAAIGDLDGDGVGDLVVGAPGDDEAATDAGAVYVLLLTPDGGVKSAVKITSARAGFDGELGSYDNFGASVAVVTPAASGSTEILVGAPREFSEAGSVFVLELDAAGEVVSATETSADDDAIDAPTGLGFGAAVAVPGDIDGNGAADFVVGAPNSNFVPIYEEGSVWVLLRSAAGGVQSAVRVGSKAGGFPYELPTNARFGASAGALGDSDDNEVPDVLVGASGERAFYALMLASSGTVVAARRFDYESVFEPYPVALGTAIAVIGDVDNNGVPDFAVGGDEVFDQFPGTTTTTFVCTTYFATTTTETTSTTALGAPAMTADTPPLCAARLRARRGSTAPAVRDTTRQPCYRESGTDICGRPKYRRCGDERVHVVFLDENADIATCGDSVRDAGEACDDGNTEDGDCCTADCLTAPSGNQCRFDGNPCAEHRCNGNGGCELVPLNQGQQCVDFFGCVDEGVCTNGSCVADGGVQRLCRDVDDECHACGQPLSAPDSTMTATDALFILRAAVGHFECLPCICDVDDDGSVTASDALATLFRVVQVFDLPLDCPHR